MNTKYQYEYVNINEYSLPFCIESFFFLICIHFYSFINEIL